MMAREGTPVIEPITDLSRKGQQFAGMTVKMQIQAAGIYQRIESTLCRDYVLSFAVASPSQDELKKTLATFDSLEFSGCK
ncbi:MAG: hypothetical protein JWO20_813 [Candidatus Angelobacter sp.]|jgi:hypothetical protein|nr:hypothetical protein [Candidatus Angelobacter sp.]